MPNFFCWLIDLFTDTAAILSCIEHFKKLLWDANEENLCLDCLVYLDYLRRSMELNIVPFCTLRNYPSSVRKSVLIENLRRQCC